MAVTLIHFQLFVLRLGRNCTSLPHQVRITQYCCHRAGGAGNINPSYVYKSIYKLHCNKLIAQTMLMYVVVHTYLYIYIYKAYTNIYIYI